MTHCVPECVFMQAGWDRKEAEKIAVNDVQCESTVPEVPPRVRPCHRRFEQMPAETAQSLLGPLQLPVVMQPTLSMRCEVGD